MTQTQLSRAVACATGESLCFVRSLGFGLANPLRVRFDPEPRRREKKTKKRRRSR